MTTKKIAPSTTTNKILSYVISGIKGFDRTTFFKAMKAKYDEIEVFRRAGIILSDDLIEESWEDIKPLTIQEALQEVNIEKRRALFSALGPARLFKEMDPVLVSSETLTRQNKTWDEKGKEAIVEIKDTYELYKIPAKKLFAGSKVTGISTQGMVRDVDIYAVRCWCTGTGREYWIFVESNTSWWSARNADELTLNPISAIAWTFRVNYDSADIEALYRQGDCLIVKPRKGAKPSEYFRHLDEETYRTKLIAQS